MAKGKRSGKGNELRYAAYKQNKTWEANRKKRLARALKRNPENTQIEETLKGGLVYRRSTPNSKQWSSTKRSEAILFKEFRIKVSQVPKKTQNVVDRRSMFSIGVRIG